jgi:nitroreductase
MAESTMMASAANGSAAPTAQSQVLDQILGSRSSCRGYLNKQVPRETIEDILRLSQRTPSWCNSQPWQLTITSGAATDKFREQLVAFVSRQGDASPDFQFPRDYTGAYLERRRESGFQLYNALGIPRGDKQAYNKQAMENFRFFGAPHVAIITTEEDLGIYGAVDCGAYVSTFVLAAEANGVATIPQAALARYSPFIRQYFGIPDNRRVVCGISFGYADRSHPANNFRTSRADISSVVNWVE